MYRVDGSSDLVEETLDHLDGYRGSRPVRVGNGAADQLQLDIYGEAMDSIYLADTHGLQLPHAGWTQVRNMLDWVCDNWDRPEEGIWETRGGRPEVHLRAVHVLGRAGPRRSGSRSHTADRHRSHAGPNNAT